MRRHGINIFTNAFNRMRQLFFFLCLFYFTGLRAQFSVRADTTFGCNPLRVYFSVEPDSLHKNINSIVWDFGNGETSTNISSSTIYADSGLYSVACIINVSDDISVPNLIRIIDCSDSLDIPNVFSPNDDQFNNFFEVETNGVDDYSFSVFTRSGTLVYKSESPRIFWDGRSLSGQKMKSGIYFYTIRRIKGDPLNEFKGVVYLFE